MTIGEKIQNLRKQRGMSQEQLAEALGVPFYTSWLFSSERWHYAKNVHKIHQSGLFPLPL